MVDGLIVMALAVVVAMFLLALFVEKGILTITALAVSLFTLIYGITSLWHAMPITVCAGIAVVELFQFLDDMFNGNIF